MKALPALADVVLVAREGGGTLRPNARGPKVPKPGPRVDDLPVQARPARGLLLAGFSEVVAVRPRGWSDKKKPRRWTDALARELTWGLRDDDVEKFVVFLLDAEERLIGIYEHTLGSESETAVYPYHVLKMALLVGASYVVLCHNHPAGDPEPSTHDYKTTVKLREVLAGYGVLVLAHVIVGADGGMFVMHTRDGGADIVRHPDWHLPPPEGVPVVRASTGELVSPPTRASFEPYGKESIWLVKSGLVRANGRAVTVRSASVSAVVARELTKVSVAAGERQGYLIMALDAHHHLLAVEQMPADVNADALVRPATLLALLVGGRSVVIVGIDKVRSVMRLVEQTFHKIPHPLVGLADVVLLDGSGMESAHELGILG